VSAAKKGRNDSLWLTDFEDSLRQAKEQDKIILIVFSGSDWCKPCIKLSKEVFATDAFKTYARENLILLQVDFPRYKKNRLSAQQTRHNETLAERYNKNGEFPLVVLVNSAKKLLAVTGYRRGGPDKYIEHLKSLLLFTQPSIAPDDGR
ncbi:MAG: thioredoxin family protein, partial [bacterium]